MAVQHARGWTVPLVATRLMAGRYRIRLTVGGRMRFPIKTEAMQRSIGARRLLMDSRHSVTRFLEISPSQEALARTVFIFKIGPTILTLRHSLGTHTHTRLKTSSTARAALICGLEFLAHRHRSARLMSLMRAAGMVERSVRVATERREPLQGDQGKPFICLLRVNRMRLYTRQDATAINLRFS